MFPLPWKLVFWGCMFSFPVVTNLTSQKNRVSLKPHHFQTSQTLTVGGNELRAMTGTFPEGIPIDSFEFPSISKKSNHSKILNIDLHRLFDTPSNFLGSLKNDHKEHPIQSNQKFVSPRNRAVDARGASTTFPTFPVLTSGLKVDGCELFPATHLCFLGRENQLLIYGDKLIPPGQWRESLFHGYINARTDLGWWVYLLFNMEIWGCKRHKSTNPGSLTVCPWKPMMGTGKQTFPFLQGGFSRGEILNFGKLVQMMAVTEVCGCAPLIPNRKEP